MHMDMLSHTLGMCPSMSVPCGVPSQLALQTIRCKPYRALISYSPTTCDGQRHFHFPKVHTHTVPPHCTPCTAHLEYLRLLALLLGRAWRAFLHAFPQRRLQIKFANFRGYSSAFFVNAMPLAQPVRRTWGFPVLSQQPFLEEHLNPFLFFQALARTSLSRFQPASLVLLRQRMPMRQ